MNDAESCDLITQQIRTLKSQADANFWRLGSCLSDVCTRGLYKGCGYATFDEYLAKGVDVSRSEAYKWMQVAANYSESVAVEFGFTKCIAFLGYIKATPEDDLPADIARVRIPCTAAGGMTMRSVRECTTADIDAATRGLRTNATVAWPDGVKALHDRILMALPADVRASISTRGGDAYLTLSGIPIIGICDVLKAVSSAVPCR